MWFFCCTSILMSWHRPCPGFYPQSVQGSWMVETWNRYLWLNMCGPCRAPNQISLTTGSSGMGKRLGELLCLLISRDSCTSEYHTAENHTSTNMCSEPLSSCSLISPKGEQCKVLNVHAGACDCDCDCGASIVLRQVAELQLEPASSLILSWKFNHSYLTTLKALQVSASPGKETVIIGDLGTKEIQNSTWLASNCPDIRHMEKKKSR